MVVRGVEDDLSALCVREADGDQNPLVEAFRSQERQMVLCVLICLSLRT